MYKTQVELFMRKKNESSLMVRFLFGAEVNYLHEILNAKLLLMNVSSISSASQSSHGGKIATVSCKKIA